MASFLLVSLNMDTILSESTLTRRRRKLDEVTRGDDLSDAYTEILSRMQEQPRSKSKLGMNVLMWVSHAERPLQVNELCHALGVEGSIDLDIRNIPAIETLLACTLGLVTVEKSSSTVRLVHYTLQEHLSNNTKLFLKPHSVIAEVCLTYLNFPHVRSLSPTLDSVPRTAPFVKYASCYWGTHAKLETTESVKTLALELLDGYDSHISSKVLLLHCVGAEEQPLDVDGAPEGFTGLHGAAYFGCLEITVALLKTNRVDARATDFHGNAAIAWASRMGHEEVVRVLLERRDVNSSKHRTKYGSAPLLWAAENGHEGVAKILLERNGINPDKPDGRCRTPLSYASKNGHEGVVKILLERSDVNPDKPDKRGRTPLSWASQKGHEGVIAMLLKENDVNPNKRNIFGRTPLSWASENGHEGVVRMLLERDNVNPNKRDFFRVSPLSWASTNGHEGVVRMLLQRSDVSPNKRGLFRLSPLLLASEKGHEGVVKMLLERNDIDPNQRGFYGLTALGWASYNGHEGVVRALLERNDLNPDKPGWFRLTPLMSASEKGYEEIVKMLLERNDVNPSQRALFGLTPLSLASQNGHHGIERMLRERKCADLLSNWPLV